LEGVGPEIAMGDAISISIWAQKSRDFQGPPLQGHPFRATPSNGPSTVLDFHALKSLSPTLLYQRPSKA